jgi:hypothetical protein
LIKIEKYYKEKYKKSGWKIGGGGGGTTTDETGIGTEESYSKEYEEDGNKTEIYDLELVERKIKEVEDKWKIKIEKIENEKVFLFFVF